MCFSITSGVLRAHEKAPPASLFEVGLVWTCLAALFSLKNTEGRAQLVLAGLGSTLAPEIALLDIRWHPEQADDSRCSTGQAPNDFAVPAACVCFYKGDFRTGLLCGAPGNVGGLKVIDTVKPV